MTQIGAHRESGSPSQMSPKLLVFCPHMDQANVIGTVKLSKVMEECRKQSHVIQLFMASSSNPAHCSAGRSVSLANAKIL